MLSILARRQWDECTVEEAYAAQHLTFVPVATSAEQPIVVDRGLVAPSRHRASQSSKSADVLCPVRLLACSSPSYITIGTCASTHPSFLSVRTLALRLSPAHTFGPSLHTRHPLPGAGDRGDARSHAPHTRSRRHLPSCFFRVDVLLATRFFSRSAKDTHQSPNSDGAVP
jgi:hypothetical protein